MANTQTAPRPNFFQSEHYTEFFIPKTLEVWLFGDHYEAITENTPRIYLGISNHWDTSALQFATIIITDGQGTDGHGGAELKSGYIYEGKASDLIGSIHQHLISSEFYHFNA